MSRLCPGGSRVSHNFVQGAFVETAADRTAQRVSQLLSREFFAGSHPQDGRRGYPEQRITCKGQAAARGWLGLAVGIPTAPHDPEQWYLGVQSIQLREPLTGELSSRRGAFAQAVVLANRRKVVVAGCIGPAVRQDRSKLLKHDRTAGMGALFSPTEAGFVQADLVRLRPSLQLFFLQYRIHG